VFEAAGIAAAMGAVAVGTATVVVGNAPWRSGFAIVIGTAATEELDGWLELAGARAELVSGLLDGGTLEGDPVTVDGSFGDAGAGRAKGTALGPRGMAGTSGLENIEPRAGTRTLGAQGVPSSEMTRAARYATAAQPTSRPKTRANRDRRPDRSTNTRHGDGPRPSAPPGQPIGGAADEATSGFSATTARSPRQQF
jgi:hypothetical protein